MGGVEEVKCIKRDNFYFVGSKVIHIRDGKADICDVDEVGVDMDSYFLDTRNLPCGSIFMIEDDNKQVFDFLSDGRISKSRKSLDFYRGFLAGIMKK